MFAGAPNDDDEGLVVLDELRRLDAEDDCGRLIAVPSDGVDVVQYDGEEYVGYLGRFDDAQHSQELATVIAVVIFEHEHVDAMAAG